MAQAQEAIDNKNYRTAIGILEHVIKRDSQNSLGLKAAREAARISTFEIKDYKKAIEFNRVLVLYSPNPEERVNAQKEISNINFDHLQNYQEAVTEFSKLLQMPLSNLESAKYKISISRANYYVGNFFQAESEINELLRLKLDREMRFNALVLLGNILVAKKEFLKAADVYRGLIRDYNEMAMKENVPLTLAVCYEESSDYVNAIKTLETMIGKYSPPEYIELRIKRLKERLRNQPGAKGFRK